LSVQLGGESWPELARVGTHQPTSKIFCVSLLVSYFCILFQRTGNGSHLSQDGVITAGTSKHLNLHLFHVTSSAYCWGIR
jgi:hypothetical protein